MASDGSSETVPVVRVVGSWNPDGPRCVPLVTTTRACMGAAEGFSSAAAAPVALVKAVRSRPVEEEGVEVEEGGLMWVGTGGVGAAVVKCATSFMRSVWVFVFLRYLAVLEVGRALAGKDLAGGVGEVSAGRLTPMLVLVLLL